MKKIQPAAIGTIFVFLFLTSGVSASTEYQQWLDEAYPADGPGAAVIVVKNNEVVFRSASGMADMELNVPLTPENVFRLGSITKQFTASAILLLEEQGKLSIGDNINKYLPDYPTQGHAIKIEHLLSHTSGVFNYTHIPGYIDGGEIRKDLTTEELITVFENLPMDFAPGEQFGYSNSGYVLLGAIIEKVSELSYAEFIQTNIFDKLEMKNSYYGGPQIILNRAKGYEGEVGNYSNADFLSMTQPHAAGSLLSTVDDMAIWSSALFGGKLLSKESLKKMTTGYKLNNGEISGFGFGSVGFGFLIRERFGEKEITHGGAIPGFRTQGIWLPESNVYVVVLSNILGRGARFLSSRLAFDAAGTDYPKHTAINIDPNTLDEYQGVYRINENEKYSIIADDGHLYIQTTGKGRDEIIPHAEDKFFLERDPFIHLAFNRDREGNINSFDYYSNGSDKAQSNVRESDLPENKNKPIKVSAELYDLLEGSYALETGLIYKIRRDDSRLLTQLGSQAEFEFFPLSKTRYFAKQVDAEIQFSLGDDGRAETVTLYQNGDETVGNRVE